MINDNHMTMRLTMVNLVVAKGSRNQCTTSLTPKSVLQKNMTHMKERRSTKQTILQ